MPKTENMLQMLEFLNVCPQLKPDELAHLCGVSKRAIYRYLETLKRVGYEPRSGRSNVLKGLVEECNIDELRSVRKGLLLLSTLDRSARGAVNLYNAVDDADISAFQKAVRVFDKTCPTLKRSLGRMSVLRPGARPTKRGGTITIGHTSKPRIMNPILTSDSISASLMSLVFNSLVTYGADGRIVPDIAKAWQASENGTVWRFSLCDDVVFHDGHPLTAHDVEFTYKTMAEVSSFGDQYAFIKSVIVEADNVVTVGLEHPFQRLPPLVCPIVPRHLLENTDLQTVSFNRQPVGSGPFRVTGWTDDDTITLEANPQYHHLDRPALERIIFRYFPNSESASNRLAGSKVDIALDLTASDIPIVNNTGQYRVYSIPARTYYALFLNCKKPLFSSPLSRRAIDHIVDKRYIRDRILHGHSEICTGPLDAYCHARKAREPSSDKAKELLRRSGWTEDGGLLLNNGSRMELTMGILNSGEALLTMAAVLKAQFIQAGIQVASEVIDRFQGEQDMFLTTASITDIPHKVLSFWHSQGSQNLAGYANDGVDALLDLALETSDASMQERVYSKTQALIYDDAPAVFIGKGVEYIASRYRFDTKWNSTWDFFASLPDWQFGAVAAASREERLTVASA